MALRLSCFISCTVVKTSWRSSHWWNNTDLQGTRKLRRISREPTTIWSFMRWRVLGYGETFATDSIAGREPKGQDTCTRSWWECSWFNNQLIKNRNNKQMVMFDCDNRFLWRHKNCFLSDKSTCSIRPWWSRRPLNDKLYIHTVSPSFLPHSWAHHDTLLGHPLCNVLDNLIIAVDRFIAVHTIFDFRAFIPVSLHRGIVRLTHYLTYYSSFLRKAVQRLVLYIRDKVVLDILEMTSSVYEQ